MNIEEAIEEFSFFNEGDYITRNMEVAKDIVLTAYKQEKKKRIELQQKLDYLSSLKDCDEEFEL